MCDSYLVNDSFIDLHSIRLYETIKKYIKYPNNWNIKKDLEPNSLENAN